MFRSSSQRGRLSIFFSVGSKPLFNWETHIKNGYITRFLDPDLKSMVLEIGGLNVNTSYMVCPPGHKVLGISMPFMVMIIKNMKKYFAFEVTVLDETGTRRRFRVGNFQSQTKILPLSTVMPLNLADGWNQIQFNLHEFTKRVYNKHFVEVQKVKINANIRLRRIYFTEKLVPEHELPLEYRIFIPTYSTKRKVKEASKESIPKTAEEKRSETMKDKTPSIRSIPIEGGKTSKPTSSVRVTHVASQTEAPPLSESKAEVVSVEDTKSKEKIQSDTNVDKQSATKVVEEVAQDDFEKDDETGTSPLRSKSSITSISLTNKTDPDLRSVESRTRAENSETEPIVEGTDKVEVPPGTPVTGSKSALTDTENIKETANKEDT